MIFPAIPEIIQPMQANHPKLSKCEEDNSVCRIKEEETVGHAYFLGVNVCKIYASCRWFLRRGTACGISRHNLCRKHYLYRVVIAW